MPRNSLQILRGAEIDQPLLVVGEPGFAIDAHRLLIGDGAVNWSFWSKAELDSFYNAAFAAIGHTHLKAGITDFEAVSATPAVNTIPKAGGDGKLAGGWFPFGSGAGTVCQGNDARLSNTRTPSDLSVTNAKVASDAAIAESKLALNYATHSNANDPSAGQKAALAGTSGTPADVNRYVTDADARNTNARTPTAHQLDGALHTVSGLTGGQFLKALTATTFGFAAHGLSYGDVGAAAASHTHAAGDITSGQLIVAQGGTGLATLAAGYIPFGAGTAAFGSDAALFWDNTNKRLGIGGTPSYPLHTQVTQSTNATTYLSYNYMQFQPTAGGAGVSAVALQNVLYIKNNANIVTTGGNLVAAMSNILGVYDAGSVDNCASLYNQVGLSGGTKVLTIWSGISTAIGGGPGSIGTGYLTRFSSWSNPTFGTLYGYYVADIGTGVTNFTALYIATQGATGTKWGLYVQDTGKNYLAGNVLVGTLTDGRTAGGSIVIAKDLAHRGTLIGLNNVAPVAQSTGWSVTAGYTATKAFNPEATTLTTVARVLGTVLDYLKLRGDLGA